MKKKYKTGIALGGGGTRGYAHLGVLKALNEKGIFPDMLAGTSIGSVVGAFIAAGKTPEEVYELLKDKKFSDFTHIKFPGNGLFSLEGLGAKLLKENQVSRLEDLSLPLYVTISNLTTGQVEYVKKGPVEVLVLASASIPVLFEPVEYKGCQYVDGGLFDNVPTEPLVQHCEKVIAVNVNPVSKASKLKNLKEIATRTFLLNVNATISETDRNCDVFLEPPGLDKFDVLDARDAEEMFQIGYEYTQNKNLDDFFA